MAVARRAHLEEHRDAMFAGRPHQHHRGSGRAPRGSADAQHGTSRGRWPGRGGRRAPGSSTGWARWLRPSVPGSGPGPPGKRIAAVVNIGIGGSDLGPAMAYEALRDYATPDIECRFVSNIDPVDLYAKVRDLDPAADSVRRQLQDVHHPGDVDQRPSRPAVAAGRAGSRRRCGGPPLRSRLHQRGRRPPVRHRPRQHVRRSGTGWAGATPTTRPSGSP